MYGMEIRVTVTRDSAREGSFICEMSSPLARPHAGVATSMSEATNLGRQTQDFSLFAFVLFRLNMVVEFEIVDSTHFRIVPSEGQEATDIVRRAMAEPFGDIYRVIVVPPANV